MATKKKATPAKSVRKAPVVKKAAPKKVAAKKPVAKKPAPKKAAPKKVAPKKTAPKKVAAPKAAPKKAAVKKAAPKKAVVKKAAPKKVVVKKAAAPKAAPKKAVAKPAAPKKAPAKKSAANARPAPKAPPRLSSKPKKPLSRDAIKKATKKADMYPPMVNVLPPPLPGDPSPARPTALKANKKGFTKKELDAFRVQLEDYRETVVKNLNALAEDNLRRSPQDSSGDLGSYSTHMADHGTDNFDRELALNLASGQQDSIYDIDDALHRISEGNFGVCEQCGNAINIQRLRALPFARKCLACQSADERGRTIYRPFGRTISQQPVEPQNEPPQPR